MVLRKKGMASKASGLVIMIVFLLGTGGCAYKRTARRLQGFVSTHDRELCVYEVMDAPTSQAADPAKHVTILIHGTNLSLMAAERCAPSFCSFALTYFFSNPMGIKPAPMQEHVFKHLAQSLCLACPDSFDLEHFYFFDWSGRLAPEERARAAADLYDSLVQLTEEPRYKDARITLIGYSHGANVAVQMSAIAQEKGTPPFSIDRLVMLACPVQEATRQHISSPLFKRIYHLYSPADLVQVMDTNNSLYKPGETQWGLSRRVFYAPQDNLVQVKVTLNGRSFHHKDFVSKNVFQALPSILCTLEQPLIKETLPSDKHGIYHFNLITRRKYKFGPTDSARSFSHMALSKKNTTQQTRIDLW